MATPDDINEKLNEVVELLSYIAHLNQLQFTLMADSKGMSQEEIDKSLMINQS